MKHRSMHAVIAALLLLTVSGCYTMHHTVGTGAASGIETEERAWYGLWGLIPIHEVDGGRLAGGAGNYTIETKFTVIDIVIGFFTGIISIQPQTVVVTR